MREPDEQLAAWVRQSLRQPVVSTASRRAAIMDRVRAEPARRAFSAPMRASRWGRRGLLTPVGGVAIAAALMAMLSLRDVEQRHWNRALEGAALMLGDSVVPHAGAASSDTVGSRLLDTLRIVEFVLRGPSVRSAMVVGEFNAWQRGATTLTPAADGAWRARVLVPRTATRDALRFAYVVNDAQVVRMSPVRPASDSRASSSDSI